MKHSLQSATQFINKRKDHLRESKLQCKYNQCQLEQQSKETGFTLGLHLSSYISCPTHHYTHSYFLIRLV